MEIINTEQKFITFMVICLTSYRFHPSIGGTETYLKNIVTNCSKYFKIILITSDLRNRTKLEKKNINIKSKYDFIPNNVEIIRVKELQNYIFKGLLHLNQIISNEFENLYDKLINPSIYNKEYRVKINQKLLNFISKSLIFQKSYTNPYLSRIYYILEKIHEHQRINVIQSTQIHLTSTFIAFRFSKKKHIPYICRPSYHIRPYKALFFAPSYQYILKNSDAIISLTNLERKFYEKYGINKNKIFVIPPGIEPKKYEKPNIKNFKQNFNIPEGIPLLFYLGRKDLFKGVFNSILALKHLIRKFKDIKLIIAGEDTQIYNSFFKNLPLQLKNHIIDLGLADERTKLAALACCDVFLLPSLDEAFGIVYLEAWLFKKPVIGALEGNVASVIDNNKNGFLIPFKNIKLLVNKIEYLLKNNKIRESLGQNGYNKLFDNYLLKKTNNMILDLYRRFI